MSFHVTVNKRNIAAAKEAVADAAHKARLEQGEAIRADAARRAPRGATRRLEDSYKLEEAGETVWVYSDPGVAPYAKYVEFGTTKMAAEPHFGPAAHQAQPRYKTRVTRAIRAITQRFSG